MVQFVGSFSDISRLGLPITLVADGALKLYLQKHAITTSYWLVSYWLVLWELVCCLDTALIYVHDSCIRYRDLKMSDVLI